MPAAALSDQFREAEIPSSSWRRPRVLRRAWTLSVVFALGCLTSFGLNRLFRPSSVDVRPAQTLVGPVEVPRSVLPSAPIDRTESPASAKPAILAQPARGVAPRAAAPPRASAPRPAPRSSTPQPVEMGNRPVVRQVAIERDEPAISGLSASLGPPDDGTPVSEPASDKTPAGSTALVPEITTAAPPAIVAPTAAIESVLKNYAHAFSARNVGAAKSVWPGVDERALARAFDGLQEQRLELERCEISVEGSTAIATCVGTARYRPKVGTRSMRSERRAWTFHVGYRGDAWVIDDVEVR
jgi:hypothetical protein